MDDAAARREAIARIISGAPFPSKRALAKADAILALPEEGRVRDMLEKYRGFAGETAGACLALAMSTDHPAPDAVLMDIFQKSQDLAAECRAALAATPAAKLGDGK